MANPYHDEKGKFTSAEGASEAAGRADLERQKAAWVAKGRPAAPDSDISNPFNRTTTYQQFMARKDLPFTKKDLASSNPILRAAAADHFKVPYKPIRISGR